MMAQWRCTAEERPADDGFVFGWYGKKAVNLQYYIAGRFVAITGPSILGEPPYWTPIEWPDPPEEVKRDGPETDAKAQQAEPQARQALEAGGVTGKVSA